MKRFAILLLASLLPLMARAQAPEIDPALLKDYIGLTNVLRAHGIDPLQVHWLELDTICRAHKDETNQVPFNQCRFQVTRDKLMYANDARFCDDKAQSEYPRSLKQVRLEEGITGDGESVTVRKPAVMTNNEHKAGRRVVFQTCMREFGWNNPGNYLDGRTPTKGDDAAEKNAE